MDSVSLSSVLRDCGLIVPELILVATMCIVILVDVTLNKKQSRNLGWIVLAGLAAALISVGWRYGPYGSDEAPTVFQTVSRTLAEDGSIATETRTPGPAYGFSRMLVVDNLSSFLKVIFLLGTIGVVIFSMRSRELTEYRHGEYYTLILASVLGGAFIISSNNFLMMVLALETLSLTSYVLAGYRKHDRLSAESSLKYILYGSVATGVMLFGISYIYGMAGTLDLSRVLFTLAQREDNSLTVLLAFVLVIGGVGFKISAVPFHFWAPDVYQGAPTPITAFLSVVSKAAGFSILFRVLLPLFAVEGPIVPDNILAVRGALVSLIDEGRLPVLFWVLSVATMTLGNLVAIRQTDIKRLLAYSSIAQAGYILMAMTVFNHAALEAMLVYFFVYMLMNLGAFLIVIVMINARGSSEIKDYRGLARESPTGMFLSVAFVIFLISLTGIPPTAGFIGKLMVFEVVVGAGLTATTSAGQWFYFSLVIIGAINTAISLYYYMGIVKAMIFTETAEAEPVKISTFDLVYVAVYALPVLLLIVHFEPLLVMVQLFQR